LISLSNVIKKIISKVIATGLNTFLPIVISKEQAGYMERKQIIDSVILSHEVIHSLKMTKTPDMIINIDLSKALERISWEYMRSGLESFGFDKHWVNWIFKLTSSAFFSILVNVVPSQPFSPSRGICQGDAFSPFLFVLMSECLGHYLKSLVLEGTLKGLPLHNLQPSPLHNHFFDDTLLLTKPIVCEANKLNSILTDSANSLGMALNLEKYKIYFFNTSVAVKNHISLLLSIPKSSLPSNYLSIPLTGAPTHAIS
jgi:hypothetical protein